jgi:hypothetical protein
MANSNQPFGLKPVRHSSGGELQTNTYPIAVGYTTPIFRGDLVEMVNDGTIAASAAANADNLGVFWGCEYDDSTGAHHFSPFWPGTASCTNIKGVVYDDPNIIFQIQSDATGAAAADVGQLVDIEYVAGDTKTGISKVNADVSGGTGATDKTLRILRIVDDGVNVAGAYSVVEVLIAEHVMSRVVAGVGGI